MPTFRDLGIEHRRREGTEKVLCPLCSHTRRKNMDPPLSLDHDEGLYNCHHCGWGGSISDRGKTTCRPVREKVYRKPEYMEAENIAPCVIEWFKGRGISSETLAARMNW